ncbi:MAG: DUF1611 domain-containing protein [Chloroflexi bacterium]|nr:DUF1611 domain-containing protein [Chloroflexota bacterium]
MGSARDAQTLCILAEGAFDAESAKTGTGVIRYGERKIVAVIDSQHAGQDVGAVIGVGHGIPIVCDIGEALRYQPDALLIGISPRGGALPETWLWQLRVAIENGVHIINGLHVFLREDESLAVLAREHEVELWDVREPVGETTVAQGCPHRPGSHTILFVGSDCSIGKMTAALECHSAAIRRGWRSKFVATGQTGIIIAGDGIPLDRIIGDFMPGSVERAVVEATREHDWVWVEGQGSLVHPAYSPVTLALVHGARADTMVLVHKLDRTTVRGYDVPLPSLPELIRIYESAASWVKPSRVCAVALNTFGVTKEAAQRAVAQTSDLLGLPVTDPVRWGAELIIDAVAASLQ